MSSINGLIANGFNVGHLNSFTHSQQGSGAIDRDGDNDGSRAHDAGQGNSFVNAIIQALSQAGVTPGTSQSDTSSATPATDNSGTTNATQDPQQALNTFMQDLFGALQAQGNNQPPASDPTQTTSGTDSDGDNDGSSAAGNPTAVRHGQHGHHNYAHMLQGIESRLQGLIQQLSSDPSTSYTSDASTSAAVMVSETGSPATATASDSGSPTTITTSSVSTLQQDFNNLLEAFGASDNKTSLAGFLQDLNNNLQANNPGANVNTRA